MGRPVKSHSFSLRLRKKEKNRADVLEVIYSNLFLTEALHKQSVLSKNMAEN